MPFTYGKFPDFLRYFLRFICCNKYLFRFLQDLELFAIIFLVLRSYPKGFHGSFAAGCHGSIQIQLVILSEALHIIHNLLTFDAVFFHKLSHIHASAKTSAGSGIHKSYILWIAGAVGHLLSHEFLAVMVQKISIYYQIRHIEVLTGSEHVVLARMIQGTVGLQVLFFCTQDAKSQIPACGSLRILLESAFRLIEDIHQLLIVLRYQIS